MGQLQDLAARLVIPGMPGWTGLVILLLLLLVGLAYLLMPFAVFGVKGRLDVIEAQLDEIQAEIRGLSLRLSEGTPRRLPVESDDWMDAPAARRASMAEDFQPRPAPPVPPPAAWPENQTRGARNEPRLDWPGPGRRG
jgi:hypothetical protein